MAASAPIPKRIYFGPFVHSLSLSELEICERGAVGVDSNGVIRFVERGVSTIDQVRSKYSEWNDADVVELKKDGFFFPGFIGMSSNHPMEGFARYTPGHMTASFTIVI